MRFFFFFKDLVPPRRHALMDNFFTKPFLQLKEPDKNPMLEMLLSLRQILET